MPQSLGLSLTMFYLDAYHCTAKVIYIQGGLKLHILSSNNRANTNMISKRVFVG